MNREDFPILQKHPELIYFDNACTTLKPKQVIEAVRKYYEEMGGCAGRSSHKLSKQVSEAVEESREIVGKFLNVKSEGVVWTKNCTEALNLIAKSYDLKERKKIVLTILEHHSSLLPFKMKEKEGVKIEYVKPLPNGIFDISSFEEAIDEETGLVVVHHTNNTVGTKNDIEEIAKIAHEKGAKIVVDGAQGIAHSPIDMKKLDIDFLAFSGHKMLGPTGIGALVAQHPELLEELEPFIVGGDTIKEVQMDEVVWADIPKKFEGGIQNYAGIIGLGEAVKYLKKIGMENIEKHEKRLMRKTIELLQDNEKIKIYGPKEVELRTGIFTFNVRGMSPHEVAIMLDRMKNIAVRSGMFCAQIGLEHLGACEGAVRASYYIYNTEEEVEVFAQTLEEIAELG